MLEIKRWAEDHGRKPRSSGKDISEEVVDFELKFNIQFNQQKVKNSEINKELNELKNELLKTKNLLVELKDRTKALQLRVDGDTGNNGN